jgi:hypothetical protein
MMLVCSRCWINISNKIAVVGAAIANYEYINNFSAQKLRKNVTHIDTRNPILKLIIKHIPHNNKPLTNPPNLTITLKSNKAKTATLPSPNPLLTIPEFT